MASSNGSREARETTTHTEANGNAPCNFQPIAFAFTSFRWLRPFFETRYSSTKRPNPMYSIEAVSGYVTRLGDPERTAGSRKMVSDPNSEAVRRASVKGSPGSIGMY